MGLDEDAVLLPILGAMAEDGNLRGQHVEVKKSGSIETTEEELAVLLINLAQETWQSGHI